MPGISKRGSVIPASPIRKLAPLADAAKARGVKVYHLNIGQPDLPSPVKAIDAMRHLDRNILEYTSSQGLLSLRERMAAYYRRFGVDVSPDEILVTAGGSEGLLLTFLACFDPGDELIVTEPGYANYLAFAISAGMAVNAVSSDISSGFALPKAEAFEAAITPRTRAILLCNPNNPTGYLYSPEELRRLRDIVLKHDLFLIVDEVYREFVYNGEPFLSALNLEGARDHVIVVDSVSKRYSECGIRIGMIVTRNTAIHDAVLRFAQSRLCPPLLGQIVAEASIDGTEDYTRRSFEEYKSRRDFFIRELNKIPGVYSPLPEGAFYTVASLPVKDTEAFCRWCLSDFVWYDPDRAGDPAYAGETVMMAPASGFYVHEALGRSQVRMAYVLCQADLARALRVLAAALEAYAKEEGRPKSR